MFSYSSITFARVLQEDCCRDVQSRFWYDLGVDLERFRMYFIQLLVMKVLKVSLQGQERPIYATDAFVNSTLFPMFICVQNVI